MTVKDFANACSIGTKIEVVTIKNDEIKTSLLERGSGAIRCETKDFLDICDVEIIYFRASGNDKMTVYCGEWK